MRTRHLHFAQLKRALAAMVAGETKRAAARRPPCAVAVMYLNASGIPVDPNREQLTALAHELYDPRCTAARITEHLPTWRR